MLPLRSPTCANLWWLAQTLAMFRANLRCRANLWCCMHWALREYMTPCTGRLNFCAPKYWFYATKKLIVGLLDPLGKFLLDPVAVLLVLVLCCFKFIYIYFLLYCFDALAREVFEKFCNERFLKGRGGSKSISKEKVKRILACLQDDKTETCHFRQYVKESSSETKNFSSYLSRVHIIQRIKRK